MIYTLPNLLSLVRLCLALAFPLFPPGWRLAVVLIGGGTDLVDGVLSRWLGVESTVGRILDPIADKMFVVMVVGTLLFEGQVQWWEVLLVGMRDWVVLGGGLIALIGYGASAIRRMPPSLLGKLTTALQFAFLLAVLIDGRIAAVLLVPTALCSAAAGADYVRRFRAREARREKGKDDEQD